MSYPDGRVRRYMPLEAERLQGFPDGWTIPEAAGSPAADPDSPRYHALGNAVTVPVAEWLARRIETYLMASGDRARSPEFALAPVV